MLNRIRGQRRQALRDGGLPLSLTLLVGFLAAAIVPDPYPGTGSVTLAAEAVAEGDTTEPFTCALHPGWPRPGSRFSDPMVADLDLDGLPEVLTASAAWKHDGTLLVGWTNYPTDFSIPNTAVVGDIDGDGEVEVVYSTLGDGRLLAFNADGTIVPGFPVGGGDISDSNWGDITLANLDGDPGLEIIFPARNGRVSIFKGDGTPMAGWPQFTEQNLQTTVAVGDIDGDGDLEIVVRQWSSLWAFERDGSLAPGSWPVARPISHFSPVLADLDSDGDLEILDVGGSNFTIYDHWGSPLVQASTGGVTGFGEISVGDIDGDGNKEIFFGDPSGTIFGMDRLGHILPGWPRTLTRPINGAPLLVDVDGDPELEILVTAEDGKLYAWDPDGSLLVSCVIGDPYIIQTLHAGPAAGDLDGDGLLEIVATDEDGWVYVLDSPGFFDPAHRGWQINHRDARHTGNHEFTDKSLRPNGLTGVSSPATNPVIDLAWLAPDPPSAIAGYDVYRDGEWLARLGRTVSYTDPTVVAGATYDYHVIGFDGGGVPSPASNVARVTAGRAQEVVDIIASLSSPFGRGSGTVSWSTTVEADLRGFNVIEITDEGVRVQLNDVLIPCLECNAGLPASYVFVVPKHKSRRGIYVEMVGMQGPPRLFGPAERAR